MNDPSTSPTALLQRLAAGEHAAAAQLLPLVYGELQRVAESCMRDQAPGHTLQPTALVHEAWLKLFGERPPPQLRDRGHFLSVAARAMRQVLVDHARGHAAAKRGGGARRVGLELVSAAIAARGTDVVLLHEALEEVERLDPQLGQVVELRYFAGLTLEETGAVLALSVPTVERRWRVARMLLRERVPALD